MHVGVNPGAPRSQRFMSDPQELESQIAVSHLMWMLGITPVLRKSSKCFQLLSHFSSPWFLFLFSDYLKHCKNRDGAITRTCDISEAEVQCLAVEDKEEEGRERQGRKGKKTFRSGLSTEFLTISQYPVYPTHKDISSGSYHCNMLPFNPCLLQVSPIVSVNVLCREGCDPDHIYT